MRRVALGLIVFFLCSFTFVSAGESYDMDFSGGSTQAIFLHKGDEVRFSLLGGDHVLILDDVGTSSVKVKFGPFLNATNTKLYPGLITLDYIMKLDLDKDGSVDVNVALYSISEDGEVHLVLQDVSTQASSVSDSTGLVGEDTSSLGSWSGKTLALVVIGVLILGVVLFLVFRGGSQDIKEEKTEQHKEKKPETKVEAVETPKEDSPQSNVEGP